MARRSGLGRGLAALIPPSSGDQERAEGSVEEDPEGELPIGEPPTPGARMPDGSEPTVATGPDAQPSAVSREPDTVDAPIDVDPAGVDPGLGEPAPAAPHSDVTPQDPEPGEGHLPRAERPLANTDVATDGPAVYAELAPEDIRANPRQPREVFDPDEIEGLATSLRDVGVLQPLVVRPLEEGGYELVAGERRLRAARLAGLTSVPALIRRTEDADLLKEALVENIHRVQLNPLEEAAAYQQLLEEFGVSQEELARRLGRSRPAISNAIRLLALPAEVQRRVAAGVLSAGHAKALLAVHGPEQQRRIAERIVSEGLSVRATEELVRLRLTDDEPPRSAGRKRPPTAPGLLELQDDLSDALEARVRISMGTRKGKLAIEFSSVDDLERIVSVIADGLGARGKAVSTTEEMGAFTRQDD